ncbi:MAG: hypothetical protein KA974_10450 [Saprospiraceae bacterium]|nr:hypothetical protein [Saprospiraceae bacterium]
MDYESLQKMEYRKLARICEKMFVLIDANVPAIPFELVKILQKLGKTTKWVPFEKSAPDKLHIEMAFLLGKCHERLALDIEFAILTDSSNYDSIILKIIESGRSCLRVKIGEEKHLQNDAETSENTPATLGTELKTNGHVVKTGRVEKFMQVTNNQLVEETAQDTIQRLIRSGNRPAEIATLKSYIFMNNQEQLEHFQIEDIIKHLVTSQEIEIHNEEVYYNF